MTRRILRDYKKLVDDGPENGIWIKTASSGVLKEGDDLSKFYIMVRGPDGPYKGALFFFTLEPFTQYNSLKDDKIYPVNAPGYVNASNDPRVDNYTKYVQLRCLLETTSKVFIPVLTDNIHSGDIINL